MNDYPLVSVIIIFFNGEPFIKEAVTSVLAQTYSAWELLLVDDGSTDGSTAMARDYVNRYPHKIFYLQHEGHQNRGMSVSRNLGIHRAKGEYIAFLDADDVWLPHKLAQQVEILNSHPRAGMLYGATQWWFSWTGKAEDSQRDFVHPMGVPPDTLIEPPKLLIQLLKNEGVSPCTCSIMVRRDVMERIGGFEESFRGLYEDQVFCTKICLNEVVFASSECSNLYRQHFASASAVAQRTGQHRFARLSFL